MLQIHFPPYPEDHQEREDKQGLKFHRKSSSIEPHTCPFLIFHQTVYTFQDQQCIDNITLRPDCCIEDHRRKKQEYTICQHPSFLASGTVCHHISYQTCSHKIKHTAKSFKCCHRIDGEKCDQIQKIHDWRCIIIEVPCQGFETASS